MVVARDFPVIKLPPTSQILYEIRASLTLRVLSMKFNPVVCGSPSAFSSSSPTYFTFNDQQISIKLHHKTYKMKCLLLVYMKKITYQKACFSDLAIPQQTNLQGDEVGVYAFPTTANRQRLLTPDGRDRCVDGAASDRAGRRSHNRDRQHAVVNRLS